MRYLIFSLFLATGFSASAHPVAFQGSVGIMGAHSPLLTHNQLNYSHRYWLATGVHHFTRPNLDNRRATFGSVNLLLHRWNADAFQANLYAIVGAGESRLNKNESSAKMLSAAQFDIEDRKYYFLTKHLQVLDAASVELEQTMVRLGLAPYVGGFEALHTWFILDYGHSKFNDGSVIEELTPMLRFFYQNVLFELGQSFDGASKFNFVIHY